jgi:hypothetical protein
MTSRTFPAAVLAALFCVGCTSPATQQARERREPNARERLVTLKYMRDIEETARKPEEQVLRELAALEAGRQTPVRRGRRLERRAQSDAGRRGHPPFPAAPIPVNRPWSI